MLLYDLSNSDLWLKIDNRPRPISPRRRDPVIHRAMSPRCLLQHKPIDLDFIERLRPNDGLDVQIQPTTDADPSLDRVQPSLPA